ncbi:hypothetical protein ABZ490_10485 [Streptomyces sp. NPDC005811]|uniref:hypothetical protein n=1 Tax=Streptomyces sp. NPDC005811 TaxID=3154565 RepID=UPI0033E3D755
MLEVRGLAISEHVREHISACTDLARVYVWLERAGTVDKAEDLLGGAEEDA